MNNSYTINVKNHIVSIRNGHSREPVIKSKIIPTSTTKPFIKWAGSKRWLANIASELIPANWSGKYYEPFLGGGSFFFSLSPEKAVISDINTELITTYKAVRDTPRKLIDILGQFPRTEEFFYTLRKETPENKLEIAARFIYLNKTCWNGLYRVNSQGKFNTPFGRNVKNKICDDENILSASKILSKKKIVSGLFNENISGARAGDWIYLDPPYISGHQNNGFLEYNQKLFSWNDQINLAECAKTMAKQGTNILVSNADYPKVISLYKGFFYYKVERQSTIGGSVESRGLVTEALLSSYPLLNVKSVKI